MSSLATLAHTAHTAAPAFNADFYATAATVIPVLFLAINVQPVFQLLAWTPDGAPERRTSRPRQLGAAYMVKLAVYFLMVLGIIGEIMTIGALASRTGSPDNQLFIVVILSLLTGAAGAGPMVAVVQTPGPAPSAGTGKTDPA